MSKFIDLTGMVFGRLTVIKRVENSKRGESRWLCRCSCGNYKEVQGNNLKSKQVQSCGCIRKEVSSLKNKLHGMTKSRIYRIYQHMKDRCYRVTDKRYQRYGGRGIKICDEWLNSFVEFYNWSIQNGYKENLTIDRIDNNGNYEPKNCRWITHKEQNRNYSRNVLLTYRGETKCIIEWSEELGIKYQTLKYRIKRGFCVEDIMSQNKLNRHSTNQRAIDVKKSLEQGEVVLWRSK